jgi:hypothetical protein
MEPIMDASFDAEDLIESAVVKDVSSLGGPGRDGALSGGHKKSSFTVEVSLGSEQGKGTLCSEIVEWPDCLDKEDLDRVDRRNFVRLFCFIEVVE